MVDLQVCFFWFSSFQALGYDFEYDDFHRYLVLLLFLCYSILYIVLLWHLTLLMSCSFVHGRLPYNLLKPDPLLRGLLLSVPVRKVVSFFSFFFFLDIFYIQLLLLFFLFVCSAERVCFECFARKFVFLF